MDTLVGLFGGHPVSGLYRAWAWKFQISLHLERKQLKDSFLTIVISVELCKIKQIIAKFRIKTKHVCYCANLSQCL